MGLLVVALYALGNKHLGVSGGYVQVMTWVRRPKMAEMWRVWFIAGLILGSLVLSLLRGGQSIGLEYGTLSRFLPLGALIPVLFFGGMLMGFGARWAGGCTSGHGLSGTASRSPASFVATISFLGTAIAITFAIHFATGGQL
jgi:hypothetical protein